MSPPSRRDILRASGLAATITLPGCFGSPASNPTGSPTAIPTTSPAEGPTQEPTDTATTTSESAIAEDRESPTETTDQSSRTEKSTETDEHARTEASTETDEATSTDGSTEEETSTPDCTVYDIEVYNDMSRTISVSLRILEGGGEEDEDDSVVSTPTPTPTVVFSDSFRLGPDEWQKYDDIPDRRGEHRLEVDVKDGPRETEIVYGRDWKGTSVIFVDIESDDIRFDKAEQARPPGCS